MPEQRDDLAELSDEPVTFVGATAGDPKPPPGDRFRKILIFIVTVLVLIYPVAFVLAYPRFKSYLDFWPLNAWPLNNWPEQSAFGFFALALFVLNLLIVWFFVRDHLQTLARRGENAMGVFEGIAAAGGGDMAKKVNEALDNVTLLLSWRYLYAYIGLAIVTAYILLGLWGFANIWFIRRYVPDFLVPLTSFFGDLALFIPVYYVLGYLWRRFLRGLVEPLLQLIRPK